MASVSDSPRRGRGHVAHGEAVGQAALPYMHLFENMPEAAPSGAEKMSLLFRFPRLRRGPYDRARFAGSQSRRPGVLFG